MGSLDYHTDSFWDFIRAIFKYHKGETSIWWRKKLVWVSNERKQKIKQQKKYK